MALSNAQYNEIMRGYELARKENRELLEKRRREIYRAIPEFQALDDMVGSAVSSFLKRLGRKDDASAQSSPISQSGAVSQDSTASQGSSVSFQSISARRKALLQSHGYPADYLDPIYTCPDCQDTGYCMASDGTRIKCHCFRHQEADYLYEQSNLQGILTTDRFSNLTYQYCKKPEDLERLRGAVRISLEFVQNFDTSEQNLLFYGTVGTGKSFLSGCIANELLSRGRSVIYYSAIGLFDALAKYTFESFEKEPLYNFREGLYNSDLIIVDDLGTELTNSFVQSQLFSLINERALRKKSTIISTNLNLEELRDRYSDRTFSRLTRGFTICLLTGPDVRMCQKLESNTN